MRWQRDVSGDMRWERRNVLVGTSAHLAKITGTKFEE